jgi:hypothetical protein
LAGFAWSQAIPDTFEGVERVVALGDVHGDPERLVAALRQANLIDASNRWTGGAAHLVLCGDFIDRGPNSPGVLDLLMKLEPEALAAGGRLHALIGNHEAMNMDGDTRYVSAQDYESYRGPNAEQLRDSQMNAALTSLRLNGNTPLDLDGWERQYRAEHPLGWVERSLAFLPGGKYGRWLLRQNAVVKINDALYMHGGLSEKYYKRSLKDINDRVRSEMRNADRGGGLSRDEQGPLWYRGLVTADEEDEQAQILVSGILEQHGVRHIVIGHTPNPVILPRFEGRVICIDVGLARVMNGPFAYMVVENGDYFAVHEGRRLSLPLNGQSRNGYLGAALLADPGNDRLRSLVERPRP